MNCPNCGAPEKARIKICPECKHAYASQDLLELRQLEFLLAETNAWQVADSLRSPYQKRLDLLTDRLRLKPETAAELQPEPTVSESAAPEQVAPRVEFNARTPVYTGPGSHYQQLGFAIPGKKAEVIGASRNREWWVIKVPASTGPDRQGWILASEVIALFTQDVPIIQAPSIPEKVSPKPIADQPKPVPPKPPKEKVPFDQWLLSERNIKIALYTGGLLLLIAGIIFVGVNWTRIPGPGKFAITLLITGLMYLGGYLLIQRPAYRIGGVALLGIAAGFFVLNFAVLQIYVMGPRGLPDDVMWLIASPFCLLLYMLTAYWTRSDLFTYLSLLAAGSTLAAGLVVAGASELVYPLAFSLLAVALSLLAQGLKRTQLAEFTCQPIVISAHILIPLTFLWSLAILAADNGLLPFETGNLWIAFPVLVFGSIFYAQNAYWHKSPILTYLSLIASSITVASVLVLAAAPTLVYLLTYTLLSLIMLILAQFSKRSATFKFAYHPFLIISNLLLPLTYLATFAYLLIPYDSGNAWFTLPILGLGVIYYLLLAYWNRHMVFSYAGLAASAGFGFAVLFLLEVPLMVYPLAYAVFAFACLFLAMLLQETAFSDFTRFPLLSTAQLVMPLMIFLAVLGWIFQDVIQENPWLGLTTLGLAVLFYITTDVQFKRLEARWAAAILFTVTLSLALHELNISFSAISMILMVLAILYLMIGYALENRESRRAAGWPLYATAYAISILVTILALPSKPDLVRILFADVAILVASAAIHRVYWWVYGAVWLFMLPVYLTITLYVSELPYQGLLMDLLGLNYAAAGYILGRRKLFLGAPFLAAAAFLSIATIVLTWSNPITAALVMAVSAGLYFLAAYWLGWSWLLLPGLVLLNLIVLTINVILFDYQPPIEHALLISYTFLGVVFIMAGLVLQRTNQDRWSWPLYVVGAIDICATYLTSLAFTDWFTIGISAVTALMMFSFAWLEREFITKLTKFPILTYLGIGVLFIGHFLLLFLVFGEGGWDFNWPPYTVSLCAVFIALAWLLKWDPVEKIYSYPLRWSGLCLMAVPLLGSLVMFTLSLPTESRPIIVAVTYGIAGVVFTGDALIKRDSREFYFSLASFLVVIWAVLFAFGIDEPQAYIIPIGLTLLGVGWYEGTRGGKLIYMLLTYAGLILLLGSAFIQSIPRGAYAYALLLGIESLFAIGWGIRAHCRCYVQVGGLALIANAIVQLGPGFIDLPRWIQIGLTGAILLTGGMAALFKRDQILNTRQRLTDEWRGWNP
jgi:hypothetical protein